MAKIKNIELKAVKTNIGHEGYYSTGNIYMDGKKIGIYID